MCVRVSIGVCVGGGVSVCNGVCECEKLCVCVCGAAPMCFVVRFSPTGFVS